MTSQVWQRQTLLERSGSLNCVQVRLVGQRLSADLSHKPAAGVDQQDSQWVAPDWFSRSTTKYWVQPQHRMRVKCEIIKNLPVSIYEGQRRKVAAGGSCWSLLHVHSLSRRDEQLALSGTFSHYSTEFTL